MSEDKEVTGFESRCSILADLWMNYRHDEEFQDFVEYNDMGLPLAFMASEDLATPRSRGIAIINETFELLLSTLEVEDTGFESLEDLMLG
jgi:hypothetical protein